MTLPIFLEKFFNDTRILLLLFLSTLIVSVVEGHDITAKQEEKPLLTSNINVRHLPDVLSQRTVNCMYKDRYGFMWLGTNEGLHRYDGTSVKVYKADTQDITALQSGKILDIYEDVQGRLWIATFGGGLAQYKRDTDGFVNYQYNNHENSISSNVVTAIAEDGKGRLWLGTNNKGVNVFDVENNVFLVYQADVNDSRALVHNQIQDIQVDNFDRVWIATPKGVDMFSPNTKHFLHFLDKDINTEQDKIYNVRSMTKDIEGNIWLGTSGDGLVKLSFDENRDANFYSFDDIQKNGELPDQFYINAVCYDIRGYVWISQEGKGIRRFDIKSGRVEPYVDSVSKTVLEGFTPSCLYVDNQDKLWVGTYNSGFYIVEHNELRFGLLRTSTSPSSSISSNSVSSLAQSSDGDIWIGTNNAGVNCLSPFSGKVKVYDANSGDFPTNLIIQVYVDKKDNVWASTWSQGIYVKWKGKDHFELFPLKTLEGVAPQSLSSFALCDDRYDDNFLWIGLWGVGLAKVHKYTLEMDLLKEESGMSNNDQLSSLLITSLYQDAPNSAWVGTYEGLNHVRLIAGKFTNTVYKASEKTQLSHNNITYLYEGREGRLWIGTEGGGLNLYDKYNKQFAVFDKEDGLSSNVINAIIEDRKGDLWLGTGKGICKLMIKESKAGVELNKVFSFDTSDGLQGMEFSKTAMMDDVGRVWMAGNQGVNYFVPKDIKVKKSNLKVYFTDLSVFYKAVSLAYNGEEWQHISTLNKIVLPYDQNVFSVSFVAPSFSKQHRNEYAYRVEGTSLNEWYDIGSDNKVDFTMLPAGDYELQVKVANSDGLWSDKIAKLKITILPAWWVSWWFMTLVLILLTLLLFGLYLFRVKQLRRQKITLERLVKSRTETLLVKQEELETHRQELIGKQEEMIQQNKNLKRLSEKITSQRNHIEAQNLELEGSISDIKIGKGLREGLLSIRDMKTMVIRVYLDLREITDVKAFAIGVHDDVRKHIVLYNIENDEKVKKKYISDSEPHSLAIPCFRERRVLLYHTKEDIVKALKINFSTDISSILYVPLISRGNCLGVITMQSSKDRAYDERIVNIIQAFAPTVAATIDNLNAQQTIQQKSDYINASMRYMEAIQYTMTSSSGALKDGFSQYFVLFKPKEVISGDFYWTYKNAKGQIFLATVDCTGHGVPGAIISMVGSTILNKLAGEKEITNPAIILEMLHIEIMRTLRQKETQNNDGMDIGISVFTHQSDGTVKMQFSGARSNLFLYKKEIGECDLTKGSRRSVGGWNTRINIPFIVEDFILSEGDAVYMTTDGFVDQNNPDRRKFNNKNFARLIEQNAHLPMRRQKGAFEEALYKFMDGDIQRDDMTVVGIRI